MRSGFSPPKMGHYVKVAVVGLGKMGILHSAILQSHPQAELCAIVESQPLIRRFSRKLLPKVRFFDNVDLMMRKETPDAVFVTTPTATHARLGEIVLEGGANLFLEKPLADKGGSSRRLVALARGSSLVTMVGYSKRFVPTFRHARKTLQEGVIGRPLSFTGRALVSQVFSRRTGWRHKKGGGGGVLAVIGSHLVDLIRWFLGEIATSKGRAISIFSEEVEDEFEANLTLTNGVTGHIECSWSRPGHRLLDVELRIRGEAGIIEVSQDFVGIDIGGNAKVIYKQELNAGVSIDIGGPEYTLEDQHFLDAIRTGRSSPISVLEGYKTQLALDALYESAGSFGSVGS